MVVSVVVFSAERYKIRWMFDRKVPLYKTSGPISIYCIMFFHSTEGEIKYIPFIAYLDALGDVMDVKKIYIYIYIYFTNNIALIFSQN